MSESLLFNTRQGVRLLLLNSPFGKKNEAGRGRIWQNIRIPISDSKSHTSTSNLVPPISYIPTTANLLDEHISAAISHIIKLCLPMHTQDTLPKVLIIGDLNARKSTLLRCQIMPVDQHP
jgi:hypothetical protein